MKRTLIRHILSGSEKKEVFIQGWVRALRKGKQYSFLILNDGSCQETMQVVIPSSSNCHEQISTLLTGSSVGIKGNVVESSGKEQSLEIQIISLEVYGTTDNTYPLQKKATSLEFLREKAHLRGRTNLFGAIFRIRHALTMSTHRFFDERGFYYINTPILTTLDAEGAGELFNVTSLDLDHISPGKIDWSKDYFGKPAALCVTGQLEAECLALGLNSVYTFGPTFRAENSNTPRHLAEFWMVEPEVAFLDLEGNAQLAEDYLKHLVQDTLNHCPSEIKALENYHRFANNKKDALAHLNTILEQKFQRITYTDAVNILQKSKQKFDYSPDWGKELQTEHERFLTEKHFKCPVIVTDYPKDCKAFYMKQNDDQKTVRAMDVLVPQVGELIGGSQREDSLDLLEKRMDELNMDKKPLWWYLELRKFGTAPHSGFGLGFERAVRYITGMQNIRDVIPFPRFPNNCLF